MKKRQKKQDQPFKMPLTVHLADYVTDCMFDGRSGRSRRPGQLRLVLWDEKKVFFFFFFFFFKKKFCFFFKKKPVQTNNVVPLLLSEYELFLRQGSSFFDQKQRDFIELVLKREEEENELPFWGWSISIIFINMVVFILFFFLSYVCCFDDLELFKSSIANEEPFLVRAISPLGTFTPGLYILGYDKTVNQCTVTRIDGDNKFATYEEPENFPESFSVWGIQMTYI